MKNEEFATAYKNIEDMNNTVNNKKKRSLKMVKGLCAVCLMLQVSFFLSSCSDFLTIYPTDRIVGEDFWKTKADVDQMVDGAYQSMLSYNVQERAIMWGAYRSDELVKHSDYSSTTLDNISAVNLLPSMGYNSWAAFYKVINNCNIVLRHAPEVMAEDPEFTQGDYDVVRAQMLALRSLCYFYLVRAFRDVPYVTESFEEDTQVEAIAQSTPADVLQNCLNDLNEASQYVMKSGSYGQNDWRNWGYITRDAVYAIMADIYLWRAAMTHSVADYQQTVYYANQIIDAKDEYYKKYHTNNVSTAEVDKYHLTSGQLMFSIFTSGNSHESILEWQYNGRNNSNEALENYYYQSGNKDNHKTSGILMASPIFGMPEDIANTASGKKAFSTKNDYRFWNNVYEAYNEEAEQLSISKMVATSIFLPTTTTTTGVTKTNSRSYEEFQQNWIVYRLTDIMLMKAEALLEIADSTDMTALTDVFELVDEVNQRALISPTNTADKLDATKFTTKSSLELLILAEREREFCFEGKRWFDLMRYCYRHMNGVNIYQKLADTNSWPALYSPMLKMTVRKYSEGGQSDAISIKMKSEPYLYWPIQESEIKVNNLLKQNPVWYQETTTSKN
jgi:hypothetical protein